MPRQRVESCPCCGRRVVTYTHSLSDLLIYDLKMLNKFGGVGTLEQLGEKMNLNYSDRANFQKLHYFGLVERVGKGNYRITSLGKGFLAGKNPAPQWVSTKDAEVVEVGPDMWYGIDSERPMQTRDDFVAQAGGEEPDFIQE